MLSLESSLDFQALLAHATGRGAAEIADLVRITEHSPLLPERLRSHIAAVAALRIAMLLVPDLSQDMGYNVRVSLTKKYLSQLGLSPDALEQLTPRVVEVSSRLLEYERGFKKDSWADLHYRRQHELLNSQNHRCKICGAQLRPGVAASDRRRPELDHIVPFALGGNHANNVRLICKGCNSAKGADIGFINSDVVSMNYFIKKSNHSRRLRIWVLERDNSTCTNANCNNSSHTSELRVVRRLPLGRAVYDNLRTVCSACMTNRT